MSLKTLETDGIEGKLYQGGSMALIEETLPDGSKRYSVKIVGIVSADGEMDLECDSEESAEFLYHAINKRWTR